MPEPVPLTTNNSTFTASATPVVPTEPVQPIAPVSGNSSKAMFLVILAAFIVVAILVGAGIYTYMTMRQTNPAFQQVSENVQQSLDSAANDISGLTEIDVNADFSEVDKELNQL